MKIRTLSAGDTPCSFCKARIIETDDFSDKMLLAEIHYIKYESLRQQHMFDFDFIKIDKENFNKKYENYDRESLISEIEYCINAYEELYNQRECSYKFLQTLNRSTFGLPILSCYISGCLTCAILKPAYSLFSIFGTGVLIAFVCGFISMVVRSLIVGECQNSKTPGVNSIYIAAIVASPIFALLVSSVTE